MKWPLSSVWLKKIYLLYIIIVFCTIAWNSPTYFLKADANMHEVPTKAVIFHMKQPNQDLAHNPVNNIQSNTPTDKKIHLHELKVSWSVPIRTIGPPVADASGVYVIANTFQVHAYNLDGTLKWKLATGSDICGAPVLTANALIVSSCNGILFCLDKNSGKPFWTAHFDESLNNSASIDTDSVYIVANKSRRSHLNKILLSSGELQWQTPWLNSEITASPTIDLAHHQIYVGTRNGELLAFDSQTGKQLWKKDSFAPIWFAASLIDTKKEIKILFSSYDGTLYMINPGSSEIYYQQNLGIPIIGPLQEARSNSQQLIVVAMAQGTLRVLDPIAKKTLWSFHSSAVPEGYIPFVPQNGSEQVFIPCTEKTICSIHLKTGKILEKLALPGSLSDTPVQFDQAIYLSLTQPDELIQFSR